MRAYLDIETTFAGSISVIGIYRPDSGTTQLVGGGVSDVNLYDALEGVSTIITFAGSSFDLPVIRKRLFADLRSEFDHRDLLYVCRRRGLRGGLKVVEQRLGIDRDTAGITGYDAPRLWDRYETRGEQSALDTLLRYNYEDVVNLALLEAILDGAPAAQLAPAVTVLMT
ncbi:ribonuclease H-like domain-containing protein [Oscillochloris sp. ZM17-4]|uniref:ribonuclease H-like domain-containing protein n=1 Tax=Oscillochloris sp. ZM17-4 TaxID=2866714 RepID=UPI001C72BEEC|nr:ribonuclease H-like domain-containing protein [Oscillochloris sp. ZM17-4]MBX0326336.1 ribonuclease H-like domain-containing protein [Oscillochloris sp. ZM17-4]